MKHHKDILYDDFMFLSKEYIVNFSKFQNILLKKSFASPDFYHIFK